MKPHRTRIADVEARGRMDGLDSAGSSFIEESYAKRCDPHIISVVCLTTDVLGPLHPLTDTVIQTSLRTVKEPMERRHSETTCQQGRGRNDVAPTFRMDLSGVALSNIRRGSIALFNRIRDEDAV
uniref:Uncharacterized protein n=1 Tax=Ascaris lumbricoides TaxID=6252 RepID=A0A0M3HTV6_ASCLU